MPASTPPRVALATALLVTAVELAVLSVALSPRRVIVSRLDTPAAIERVSFVVPPPSAAPMPAPGTTPERAAASPDGAPVGATPSEPPAVLIVPRDSAPAMVSPPRVVTEPASGRSAGGGSSTIGPALAPRGFTSSSPATRHVIDSVLDSLNAHMPALIWSRVPTQAERDAAYKESALAMQLAGRALLVPADPHLAPGIRLPSFFSRQKQREATRVRTDSILAENMARLARLRARARRDSVRRDSLQRVDSVRLADPARAATPRRRPDARTPA